MLEELTKLEGDMARLGQQHGRALLDAAADRIADKGQSRPSTRLRIGDLIEETYEALVSLGHTTSEARQKVEAVAVGGRKFKSVEDLLNEIYRQNVAG